MKRARCLVVDDDRQVAEVVSQVIENLGHLALLASTLGEARDLLHHRSFDATVLDLNVRGHSGLTLLSEFESLRVPARVILVSGSLTPIVVDEARRLGVRDCLSKPLELMALRRALRSVLEEGGTPEAPSPRA